MRYFFPASALALALSAAPAAAAAAPMTLTLTPGNMLAQTHSHAIILTISGTYQQLAGTFNYDFSAKTCSIDVTFEVRSLTAPNAIIRAQTMSKSFLDPDDYPQTRFIGTCQNGGASLAGNLTLRGQTHPFTMALTQEISNGQVTGLHAEGTLNRYDWGLTGLSMTVGKNIRVTNDISLNGQPPIPP